MSLWYVIRTNANDEAFAEKEIKSLGIETYLPQYTQRVRHARKSRLVKGALFPGYLFARFDIDSNPNWPRIFSRRGVAGVICDQGQRPRPVPEWQMERAYKIADEYEGKILEAIPLDKGQTIRIIEGMFSGFPALIERADRSTSVTAEVDIFGTKRKIILPRAHVAPII